MKYLIFLIIFICARSANAEQFTLSCVTDSENGAIRASRRIDTTRQTVDQYSARISESYIDYTWTITNSPPIKEHIDRVTGTITTTIGNNAYYGTCEKTNIKKF